MSGADGNNALRPPKSKRPRSAPGAESSSSDESDYDVDVKDVMSLLKKINKKIEKNLKDTNDIYQDMTSIKKTINAHGKRLDEAELGISKLENSVDKINDESKMIQIELKKVNLIIVGVFDVQNEPEQQLYSKIKSVIAETTDLDVPIDTYYRLGNFNIVKPRPIKVRFISVRQRNLVYNNRSELSPPIHISEDLPYTTRRSSAILRNKKKEAISNGVLPDDININYKMKQILIKDKTYCITSLLSGTIAPIASKNNTILPNDGFFRNTPTNQRFTTPRVMQLFAQSDKFNAIKIGHLNTNSLTCKYHNVDALLTLKDIDILSVSESCLKSDNTFRKFSNYAILRRDSFDSSERGIAVLFRCNISAKILTLPELKPSSNCEYTCIKFLVKKIKSFIVVCIYRHTKYDLSNRRSDYEFFRSLILSLRNTGLKFFLLGDFNLPKPNHINPLNAIIEENNCHQLVHEPTRSNNILDLIIVSDISSVYSCEVYHPFISDHKMTSCNIQFNKPERKFTTIKWRDYSTVSSGDISNLFEIKPLSYSETPND